MKTPNQAQIPTLQFLKENCNINNYKLTEKLLQDGIKITVRYIDRNGFFEYATLPDFFFDGDVLCVTTDNQNSFTPKTFAGVYTGFSDENGQEIYTGDVVAFDSRNPFGMGVSEYNNQFSLIGDNHHFPLSEAQKEGKKLYVIGSLFYNLEPNAEVDIRDLCLEYAQHRTNEHDELIKHSPFFKNACNLYNFKQFLIERGVENPWQHVADLAKKSKLGYYDPSQTYAIEEDLPILEKHNNSENRKKEHKFILSVLPCPFEGDIFNAKIIILTLNPGFIESKNHDFYKGLTSEDQKRITDYHIENLELQGKALHADEVVDNLADNYYTLKTKEIREKHGFQSSDFAVIQHIGYQSEKCPKHVPVALLESKGIKFTELLIEYIVKHRTDDYVFVIARPKSIWEPLLWKFYDEHYSDEDERGYKKFKKHVTKLKSDINTVFSLESKYNKGNIENIEIIERVAPIKHIPND